MATVTKSNGTSSFKYLYKYIAATLTLITLAVARPQIEEMLETIPNPLPDRSNPSNLLNNEVIQMNEYTTSREGVSLSEVLLNGKTIFTIKDESNNFQRELSRNQFENLKDDLNAIADVKEITDGELNLTTAQEKIFESIGFQPFDCTIQTDSGEKEEVTLYFEDEWREGDIWSINISQESASVEAQLESFGETLTMPLGQYPELTELNLDSCEG